MNHQTSWFFSEHTRVIHILSQLCKFSFFSLTGKIPFDFKDPVNVSSYIKSSQIASYKGTYYIKIIIKYIYSPLN